MRRITLLLLVIVLFAACTAPPEQNSIVPSVIGSSESPLATPAPTSDLHGTIWTLTAMRIRDEAVDIAEISPVELRFDDPISPEADLLMIHEHQCTPTLRVEGPIDIRFLTADTFAHVEDYPSVDIGCSAFHDESESLAFFMQQANQFSLSENGRTLILTGEDVSSEWVQQGASVPQTSLNMPASAAALYGTMWTLTEMKIREQTVDSFDISPVELHFTDPLTSDADLLMIGEYQCAPTLRQVWLTDIRFLALDTFEHAEDYPSEDIGCDFAVQSNSFAVILNRANQLVVSEDGDTLTLAGEGVASEWKRAMPEAHLPASIERQPLPRNTRPAADNDVITQLIEDNQMFVFYLYHALNLRMTPI